MIKEAIPIPATSKIVLDTRAERPFQAVHMLPGTVFIDEATPEEPTMAVGPLPGGVCARVPMFHTKPSHPKWATEHLDAKGQSFSALAILNLRAFTEDASIENVGTLRDSVKGCSVLLCGSGPSLADIWVNTASASKNWIVIAVNRAILHCRNAGRLDYAVVVDPLVDETFVGDPQGPGSIICSGLVQPGTRNLFNRQFGFHSAESDWAISKSGVELRHRGFLWLNSGLTAAAIAAEICWLIGADRVVLAGMDFSCPGWMEHFDRSVPDDAMLMRDPNTVPEYCYYPGREGAVPTTRTMIANAMAFDAKLELLKRDGIDVYDLSRRGVLTSPVPAVPADFGFVTSQEARHADAIL